jgi:opacity protein-like surface antigen
MLKMKTISILAIAGLVLALAPAAQADTIFAADFQGAVDQGAGAVTLGNLNAGTQTGSWSGTPDTSIVNTDPTPGTNRGLAIEQDGVNLTATFDAAGVLATNVTVSYDATVIRVHNGGRTAVMKGIASDGKVLFALGIVGNNQTTHTGSLVSYDTDITPDTTLSNNPAATTIGAITLFDQAGTVYNDGLMETIRLELTTTSFDVYINGALAAGGNDIPYFSGATAAGNIDKLNFQSDGNGGAWYDNLSVVSPPAPPAPPGTVIFNP